MGEGREREGRGWVKGTINCNVAGVQPRQPRNMLLCEVREERGLRWVWTASKRGSECWAGISLPL